MFLDPKGGDAKLLAQKLKEANIQIERRKQARKALAEVDAIGESNPSPIDISDEEGSDGEGVVEPQATASYEEEVAAAARAVAAGSEEPVGDFQCSVCREVYTKLRTLNRHIQEQHTPVEGGVPCTKDYCKRVFETRHEMYSHRDGKKDKEPCTYKCSFCKFETKKNGQYARHERKHEKMRESKRRVQDWEGQKKQSDLPMIKY